MDKIQYEKLKLDYILQTFADKELFDQWLRNFFLFKIANFVRNTMQYIKTRFTLYFMN